MWPIREPERFNSSANHPPEVISKAHDPFIVEHSGQNSSRSPSSSTRNPMTAPKRKEYSSPDERLRTVTIRSSGSNSVRMTSGSASGLVPNASGLAVTRCKAGDPVSPSLTRLLHSLFASSPPNYAACFPSAFALETRPKPIPKDARTNGMPFLMLPPDDCQRTPEFSHSRTPRDSSQFRSKCEPHPPTTFETPRLSARLQSLLRDRAPRASCATI